MNNNDTPETDAKASSHIGFYSCATVPAEFARRLERERDEARKIAQQFRSLYYTQLGIDRSASWFPWEAKS
jgi:hypothetical protein